MSTPPNHGSQSAKQTQAGVSNVPFALPGKPASTGPISQPRRRFPVFLDNEYYVEVDSEGVLLSPCAEGALGYVIQLQCDGSVGKPYALKIPRLRADTIEENASITAILDTEAEKVFLALQHGKAGLIDAPGTRRDLLQGQKRLVPHRRDDARDQDGCVPLVSFGKDHRVRICNVRFDPDPLAPKDPARVRRRVFPPGAEPHLAFLEFEHWAPYLPTNNIESAFSRPVVFRNLSSAGDSGANPVVDLSLRAHYLLAEALGGADRKGKEAWFAGLPSILFEWAHGTLQHAISNGRHKEWRLWHQYDLIQQVLDGLQTLHRRGVVHADVRPANILAAELRGKEYRDEKVLEQPDSYRLSDYGSFANDRQTAGSVPGNTGHTTMPGIARHRASIFYGRERRAGVEREDANLAVLIAVPARDDSSKIQYFVRLGWKGQLTVNGTNELQPTLLEDMRQSAIDLAKPDPSEFHKDDWNLKPYDQFRIRDLVFIIDQHRSSTRPLPFRSTSQVASDPVQRVRCLDFLCQPTYTRVLLEKIGVTMTKELVRRKEDSESKLPEYVLLDLPRWIEIRQTSFASDMYSIGVLAMYLVYTAQKAKEPEKSETDSEGSVWDEENVEESLSAIVRRFEDPNNFNHLFPQLDYVCSRIEHYADNQLPAIELLKESVQELEQNPTSARITGNYEVLPVAPNRFEQVVRNLVETTLYLSAELNIVSEYIGNYGHFLLFLHFVLSCLHRRSSLNSSVSPKSIRETFPFCQHRCDSDENRVEAVREQLRKLQGYKGHRRFFDEFHKEVSGIVKRPSQILSDYALRQRLRQETEKCQNAVIETERYKDRLRRLEEHQTQQDEIVRQLEQKKQRLTRAVQEILARPGGMFGGISIPEELVKELRFIRDSIDH